MSLLPGKCNFTLYRGGTFRIRLVVQDGDEENSPLRDLTDHTASLSIRTKVQGGTILATLTTENGGIELGGEDGTIDLFISDEDTTEFTWSVGFYTLYLTDAVGDTDPLLFGAFSVRG